MQLFSASTSAYGQYTLFRNDRDAYFRTAFEQGDRCTLAVDLPREVGGTAVSLRLLCDATGEGRVLPFAFHSLQGERCRYTLSFAAADFPVGLYFASLVVEGANGRYGAQRQGGGVLHFFPAQEEWPVTMQMLFCAFSDAPSDFLLGKVLYHIFVDRFAKTGDPCLRGGAIFNPDWEHGIPQYPEYPGAHLDNNMFFGGTLWGVIDKLDELSALGVGGIYLSPVFEATSNHKYDTGDYLRVDEAFGGDTALEALIRAAGERGIRVILDGVFNHTGDDSRYFNRRGTYDSVGAYQSLQSPYASWYHFRHFPDDYECWWNIPILPRLNLQAPACRAFFLGPEGVIAHWAEKGIGGFRLDVADELTDDFIVSLRQRLREKVPDAILYGEVWEDASNKIAYGKRRHYYWGEELSGVMNYPLRTGLIAWLRDGNPGPLRYALEEVLVNCPKRIADRQMNLLGTHDTERILTVLGGGAENGRSMAELAVASLSPAQRQTGLARLQQAYLALATLPGVPCIYYGDEAGMEGYRDPFNRRPYPWGHREEGLVSHFRAVGRLRLSQPLYREGEFRLLRLDENAFAFARTDGETALITLLTREGTKLGLPTGAEVLFRLDGGADPAAADGAVIRCTAAEAEAFCAV